MDDQRSQSRRDFLRRLSFAAALAPLAATHRALAESGAAAESCTDTSGLTEQQKQVRVALKYVDRSPHEEKKCHNCRFFLSPAREAAVCGGCSAVPGPIHPQGYCTAWAPPA